MNKVIKYGGVTNIPYYNCSGKSEEEWYATGVQRPFFGWSILIFGIFVELLYVPTMYLMFKTKLVRHSCYKIIVLLGVTDMVSTVVSSIVSGFLFIKGAVFCNFPTLIYICGSLGFSGWCCACGCTLVLVLNRVGDVIYRPLSDTLFGGSRIYVSIVIIVSYWIGTCTFTPAIIFNSQIMAWIANPLVIDNPTQEVLDEYYNGLQKVNNFAFTIVTCSLYLLYCILVNKMQKGHKSKASQQVFIQASIICFFNTFTALIYNAMLLIPTPPWVICFGELCWSGVHGAPAIIYITMNKTIRHEFFDLIGMRRKKKVGDMTVTSNKHSKIGVESSTKI